MSATFLLAGCGLGGAGNWRKVNIYPNTSTWDKFADGAQKLGWQVKRGGALSSWAVVATVAKGQTISLTEEINVCAVSADQGSGHGCAGLSFRCEKKLTKEECTKRFVTLAKASGFDPASIKVSNRMASTEGTGEPIQP